MAWRSRAATAGWDRTTGKRRAACRARSGRAGERRAGAVVAGAAAVIAAERRARLEYAEVRDPETLAEVAEVAGPSLLALAVRVGSVRLIDNRLLVPEGDLR